MWWQVLETPGSLVVRRGERGLAELSPAELDLCLRQARAAALLGRLAALTPASERVAK